MTAAADPSGSAAGLSEEQLAAVGRTDDRLKIVACAGSGKTEVLTRRAVRFLLEGVDPGAIVAFTFTEKAAAELRGRIEDRAARADPSRFGALPPTSLGMFVGTMHAWAFQQLQSLGGRYEVTDSLTAEGEWALAHRVARRLGIVDLYARGAARVAAGPAVTAFLRNTEVVHNERIGAGRLRAAAPQFAAVLERYEWLLDEMRLLPFRLMISRAADELGEGGRLAVPAAAGAADRSCGAGGTSGTSGTSGVSHLLVDEFQDLNPAQDELVRRLAALGACVTVVGDDDQAIYQWRGGDVSLLARFADRYPGAGRTALATNYRCRPAIVALGALVTGRLAGRQPKRLEAAREPARLGAVEVMVGADQEAEAAGVADRIQALLADGHPPGDIAVLCRSVRSSARPLVEELRRRGVPVTVAGATSLLAHPEMALVARVLVYWAGGRWYPNQSPEPELVTRESLAAEVAEVTALAGPGTPGPGTPGPGTPGRPAAGPLLGAIDRLGERVRSAGVRDSIPVFNELVAALGLPQPGHVQRDIGLGRMSELLAEFDHAVRRAAPAALYAEAGQGSDEAAEDAALTGPGGDAARRVLGGGAGEVYLARLRAYLEHFAARAAEETPAADPAAADAVQVMTIHQAKGLEFPVVFLPGLVEGRFPSALTGRRQDWYLPDTMFDRARYEGREADEARLLYVALTRARELVVLSWFERHPASAARRSRFLGYLGDGLRTAGRTGSTRPATSGRPATQSLLDVSFSSLATYDACPYRYWLRDVCGFQPPIAPELGFGKVLHHVIAELARAAPRGGVPSDQAVAAVLDAAWYLPFAGPIPSAELRGAALRRVTRYAHRHGTELARAVAPEASFEVPISGGRVRGRIDLLLRAPGGGPRDVEIVDFKTTENRPPMEMHRNQLRLYAAAMRRLGYRPVRLAIHDLDAGDRIDVRPDPRARAAFEASLESWIDGIRSRAFVPNTTACADCDFTSFCPYAAPLRAAPAQRAGHSQSLTGQPRHVPGLPGRGHTRGAPAAPGCARLRRTRPAAVRLDFPERRRPTWACPS